MITPCLLRRLSEIVIGSQCLNSNFVKNSLTICMKPIKMHPRRSSMQQQQVYKSDDGILVHLFGSERSVSRWLTSANETPRPKSGIAVEKNVIPGYNLTSSIYVPDIVFLSYQPDLQWSIENNNCKQTQNSHTFHSLMDAA